MKILKRIKDLFRKKPNEGWVAINNTTEAGFIKCSPEATRKMIEEAYPDGAEFLSRISAIPKGLGFMLDGGLASTSYISARGLSTSGVTTNYEELKELLERYPDWQVSIPSVILTPPTQSGFYSDQFKSERGTNR